MDVTDKDKACFEKILNHFSANNWHLRDTVMLDILSTFRTESAEQAIANLKASEISDFRMDELDAVMTSVDKWLTGAALKNNPATRAGDAREIALKAIEAEAKHARKGNLLKKP